MGDKGVDDLFQVPLGEFIAARNRLSDELKRAGKVDEAANVRGLPKPPLSAWVINQLYWRRDSLFNRLITFGEQLRTAQTERLGGAQTSLREPLEARNLAVSELVKAAGEILRESGHPTSPDTMRRIVTTLEALATYGRQPEAPPAGRLTRDVDLPGFAALASLAPSTSGRTSSRIIPFAPPPNRSRTSDQKRRSERDPEQVKREHRQKLAAAQKAVVDAQRDLAQASRAAAQTRTAMKEAAARAKLAEKAKTALEQQLEKAAADAEAVRQEARRVAATAEETAQAMDDAERALTRAKEALKALQSSSRS